MQIEMNEVSQFTMRSKDMAEEIEGEILELPKTRVVNIYDPSSIDSVITTAVITSRLSLADEMTCLPASDYLLRDQFERYNWIGVYPSTKVLSKIFKGKTHHALVKHTPDNHDQFKTIVTVDWNNEVPGSETLLEAFSNQQQYPSIYWQLAFAIKAIENGERVSLEDQAFVYANFQHARICIANKMPFEPIFYTPEMFQDYLKHLKILKLKISEIWNYTEFSLEGKTVRVPLINIGSELAPWAIKLISCSYDQVVTFEHVRGKTIYTVFSRTKGFRQVFEKCLDKRPEVQIMFSGEL
jgi:hypothetical protein